MPSKFLQRYQWIGIAAPFIAGGFITLANGHPRYAAFLFVLGAVCLYIEGAYVMRLRWRSPFYRLRNLKIEGMDAPEHYNRFGAEVAGYSQKIVNDCAEIANFLGEHERKIVRADRTTDIARRKKLAESIRQHERELCRLLTEFRGFFYAPD